MDVNKFDDIENDIPLALIELAKCAANDVLPDKSREIYNKAYRQFKDWQLKNGAATISQPVVMAYFYEMAKKYKPSSLWASYSMLKATLRSNDDIDISRFTQVAAFLKQKSSGFKSVKAHVFSKENVKKFIDDAADLQWLDVKVVLIFGISGTLRTDEFVYIRMADVEKHSDLFLVRVVQTKTKVARSFTISDEFFVIVQKYIDLRPALAPERFFINYQRGRCTVQVMGKQKISKMPKRIAEFLQLPMAGHYTGHSFRRSSATILANSGADMDTIMRHGAWRNENCAKGYIEDSLRYKKRTGNMITSAVTGRRSSSIIGGSVVSMTGHSSSSSNGQTSSSVSSSGYSNSFDNVYNSQIDDMQLIEICDASVVASQIKEKELSLPQEIRNDSVRVNDNSSEEFDLRGDNSVRTNPSFSEKSSVLTQRLNNNSSLNVALPDGFKMMQFQTLHNCTFHIHNSK